MKAFPKALIDRLKPDRFSQRERIYLLAAAVLTLGLVIYGVISGIFVYRDRMDNLDRLIGQKRQALEDLSRYRQEYTLLKGRIDSVDERIRRDEGQFSLLSFLESLAGSAQIRSRIAYMRPQAAVAKDQYREVSVEMKLENVTLDQAVKFLSAVEQAPHVVKIKNLHFRTRFANRQYLDITFLVSAFERAGG